MSDPESETCFAVAVHNTLLGVFNYIVLNLPARWRLKPSDFPSEMYSSTKVDGVRWVRDGSSVNYVYDEENALRLSIKVHEKPTHAESEYDIDVSDDRSVTVNGHTARILTGRIGRGILRKKQAEYLRMVLYCAVTKRTVDLVMEGRCTDDSLIALTDTIQHSKCH